MGVLIVMLNYAENALTAKDFAYIRKSIGWAEKLEIQIEKALKNGLYSISVYDGKNVIGMGRLVGDGAMYWYVQDVVVLTEYQGKGIGREIMKRLISYITSSSQSNTSITVGLMAAKGKAGFYTKLGFRSRPNEKEDPGMIMNIDIS